MSADTDAGGTAPKSRSRWLWIALTLSLALNLLLVGLLAGGWWMRGGHHAKRNQVYTGAIERLMEDLPLAKQETARAVLEEYRAGIKPRREQVRAARRAAREAVLAETYDETEMAEDMARLRELRTEEHAALHSMFLGLLKDLTLEERKQLLQNLREGFRKRWRKKRSKDDKPASGQ